MLLKSDCDSTADRVGCKLHAHIVNLRRIVGTHFRPPPCVRRCVAQQRRVHCNLVFPSGAESARIGRVRGSVLRDIFFPRACGVWHDFLTFTVDTLSSDLDIYASEYDRIGNRFRTTPSFLMPFPEQNTRAVDRWLNGNNR